MLDDFAVFILTHGRPNNVVTYRTLERQGYTGPVYIIVDSDDDTVDQYRKLYGDRVIVFDKLAISKTFDEGDNFQDRRSVVYARNACWDIARNLGVRYFLQLDDDYYEFQYRIDHRMVYPEKRFTVRGGLDDVVNAFLAYYKAIDAKSIAMFQGGDNFGGSAGFGKAKRKCMNTFFCSTERPFKFVGRINEDANTYTSLQNRGDLFLSIPFVMVNQNDTQAHGGGMTEIYRDSGTYIKSFYTVIFAPSCTRIRPMGAKYKRLHHSITWDNAVPKIIAERHRQNAGID